MKLERIAQLLKMIGDTKVIRTADGTRVAKEKVRMKVKRNTDSD